MKQMKTLIALLISVIIILAAISPALAETPQLSMVPRIRTDFTSTSTNWAGYAVTGAAGSVTSVSGSWIVSTVTASTSTPTAYSAFWVGIDGFSSSTVEQTGTLSYTVNGVVQNPYAWFEFYPAAMYQILTATSITTGGGSVPATVTPGDVISATVNFVSSTTTTGKHHQTTVNDVFSVTISDTSAGWTFSTQGTVTNAAMSSAEWIAEAPSSNFGVLPLANFGTVNFGTDPTGVSSLSPCVATVNGASGSIGSFGSASVQSINMVGGSRRSTFIKAQTSNLATDGTSFSVTWLHA
jgi:hypothetical protein